MNTKLIIVEGLPGFGKSTTAKLINEILTDMKIEAELFLEGNLDHPADYDGVAYFSKSDFDQLINSNVENKELLSKRVIIEDDRVLIPYHKIRNQIGADFPNELFDLIVKRDIYELPLEQNQYLIENKWKKFAQNALNQNKITIFECCFIQNPITIGMIKYGAKQSTVLNYVKSLENAVNDLNPLLIYVDQKDLEFSFRKAVSERSKEWFDGFTNYYNNQGFGKENNVNGIEGTIEVLKTRKNIEDTIFDQLEIKKVKVDNSGYILDDYKSSLVDLIQEHLK